MRAQLRDLLIEEQPKGAVVIYDIPKKGFVIGRENKDADKPRFPHPDHRTGVVKEASSFVSRKQCKVYFVDGQLAVEDIGSTHGTYVNDIRAPAEKPCVLRNEDILRLGTKYKFKVIIGEEVNDLKIVNENGR